jgi:hypothetical protein
MRIAAPRAGRTHWSQSRRTYKRAAKIMHKPTTNVTANGEYVPSRGWRLCRFTPSLREAPDEAAGRCTAAAAAE